LFGCKPRQIRPKHIKKTKKQKRQKKTKKTKKDKKTTYNQPKKQDALFVAYISTLYNNLSLFLFAASILPTLTFGCLYIDDFFDLPAIAGCFKLFGFVAFFTSKLPDAI
jgi:uncharacterized ion transporter superfamily protein YfcC